MPNTNTATNVSAGKPAVNGAVFRAPLSQSLSIPTSATATLAAAFVGLGYVSDDGVKNTNSPSSQTIKAWGGDTVLVIQTEKPDEFELTLIETLNKNVLSAVYGSTNVSGSIGTGITVNANAKEAEEAAWVIDMVLRGDVLKRIVIPDGKVSNVAEINYSDEEAIGYQLTISAMPDSSGNTHYEYIKKSATSGGSGTS